MVDSVSLAAALAAGSTNSLLVEVCQRLDALIHIGSAISRKMSAPDAEQDLAIDAEGLLDMLSALQIVTFGGSAPRCAVCNSPSAHKDGCQLEVFIKALGGEPAGLA